MTEQATSDIPSELTQKFLDKGWTPENVVRIVVDRARSRGFSLEQINSFLDQGLLTPDRLGQVFGRGGDGGAARAEGGLFNEQQQVYIDNLKQGRFDLTWLKDDAPRWGIRATPRDPARGLTLQDINAAYAGEPEDAPKLRTMAPRGAVVDPDVPDMGYTYNEKYQVWSDNVVALYEEAVARQWSATRDVPWDELKPLPDDLERAQCQISTFPSEVEMIASDFPAKWLWQMNQHFHEVKMFLCTQAMDEARHLEVFRKRALANGGGLMRCLTGTESLLRTILHAPTHMQG